MERARCRLEESGQWTDLDAGGRSNLRPPRVVLERLAMICAGCPVMAECANYALGADVEGGMYAGVWVPSTQRGRMAIRVELARRTSAGWGHETGRSGTTSRGSG